MRAGQTCYLTSMANTSPQCGQRSTGADGLAQISGGVTNSAGVHPSPMASAIRSSTATDGFPLTWEDRLTGCICNLSANVRCDRFRRFRASLM